MNRCGPTVVVLAGLLTLASTGSATAKPPHPHPHSARAVPAAPAHSRLVFAAGEEDSTLAGFSSGKAPDPRTYWTARRDLRPYTAALWRTLAAHQARLTVNIRWRRDFGPVPDGVPRFGELRPLLRAAARHHVGVIAWVTIPYGDGYWLTEDNVAAFRHALRDFRAWAHRIHFRPAQVLLDLESPLTDSAKSNNLRHNPFPVVAMLDHNVGPAHQCAAMHGVTHLARWLDAHGYPTIAAAYPFLFDDIADGDVAFSDGLDMPLPQPGTFREVSFMALRSAYASLAGRDPGSSLYASYIGAMKRWYGRSAAFTLGVAGVGPYAGHLERLVTDVRIAAALTTGTVGVYSLETTMRAYGLAGVRKLLTAVEHPLAGAALQQANTITAGTRQARAVIGAESRLVSVGLPLAMTGRGEPELPSSWPPHC